jgi:hypothetical protein
LRLENHVNISIINLPEYPFNDNISNNYEIKRQTLYDITFILYHILGTFLLSELNRIHIHKQCVNWSAGISYPHSRACPLIGSCLLGFTYCDGRESESDRNIIFRCSFIGYSFPGFHVVTTENVFLCLTMIQKRKNIKTLGNLIKTRGGYSPSYKSDSLVFRCVFYYVKNINRHKNTHHITLQILRTNLWMFINNIWLKGVIGA